MINQYLRYQKGLRIEHLFPLKKDRKCSCGCGKNLSSRQKKWWSKECQSKSLITFYVIKGDVQVIRELIFNKEEGFCRNCGVYDANWQADHIIPIFKGGGGLGLENYQTLCVQCHSNKTLLDRFPNISNIHTSGFNITHPLFNCFWTFNKCVVKDII